MNFLRDFDFSASLLAGALGLDDSQSPFPWQTRLLRSFLDAKIPRSLDIPTGLGKTATMAAWLVARSLGAAVPTRLVYIVDRRVVVDQATRAAEELRKWVDREPTVREGLRLGDGQLPVSTLRGQFIDKREWLEDPARPAIIVGTVDMIGSRLLFEGYRATRRMRPFMAGLLGHDALFVLDEAHLVPPFERLLARITDCRDDLGTGDAFEVRPPPSRLLSLSATGRSRRNEPFDLDEEDLVHPVVRKRLGASKQLEFVVLEPNRNLADAAAEVAWSMCDEGRDPIRCVVFLSRRQDAEKAKAHLEKMTGADKVKKGKVPPIITELLIGGRRVHERSLAAQRLDELGFLAGSNAVRARPHFLFATSAGEVGIDLDADHMVGDLVAWERMVQRFGRVNRRGEGRARVTILREAAIDDERIGGVEVLLGRLPSVGGRTDVSPGALRELQVEARRDPDLAQGIANASTPAPLHPPLERPTLDAWSMTSLEEHPGRPAIAPWLRGWVDDRPQTVLAWRAHLPLVNGRLLGRAVLDRFFQAAPVHISEQLETETFRVAEWLKKRAKEILPLAPKLREKDASAEETSQRIPAVCAGFLRQRGAKRFERFDFEAIDKPKKELERRLAGGELVLDARFAGLSSDGLLDPSCDDPPVTIDGGAWGLDAPFRLRIVTGNDALIDVEWRERERFPIEQTAEGEVTRWLVVERALGDYVTEEDRSAGSLQTLANHQAWTAEEARDIARRLGLGERPARLLELAARLHDEGKRSRRWQRAFNAPPTDTYAKTCGPVNISLLEGYRHELGSLPYAMRDNEVAGLNEDERDLVLHLIASHHGYARPTIRTNGADDAPPSELEARAREVAHRFARLQVKLGPWGLAWWEALLRSADQRASREIETRIDEEERPR